MREGPHNINSHRKAQGDTSEPHVGSLRPGPPLAAALYLLLVASFGMALWARSAPGGHPLVAAVAPWVFLGFVVVFALYRFALVRAGRYPAFKAFFQIGAGLLFFMLLLPGLGMPRLHAEGERPLEALLDDPDPAVRALAAEVAGYRPEAARFASELVEALEDPHPQVREQAHRSLVRIEGRDLGPPGDPEALRSWRERYP